MVCEPVAPAPRALGASPPQTRVERERVGYAVEFYTTVKTAYPRA